MLVTFEEARHHLRIDGDYDDPWLETWIPAISQAVLLWLKDESRAYEHEIDSSGDVVTDSNDDPVMAVRSIVRSAVLVELASQYRFRDGEGAAQVPSHWGHGHTLSIGATSLLTPLRKPTIG